MLYEFQGSCDSLPGEMIHELRDNATFISREAMARALHGGLAKWARSVGYEKSRKEGLVFSDDWHIGYFQSHLEREEGKVEALYLTWSGFEFVWLAQK